MDISSLNRASRRVPVAMERAEAGWVTCEYTGMILYAGWRLTQLFQLKLVPNVQGHSLRIKGF